MSAILKTSVYGDLSFETIWSHSSGLHVGKLTKGDFCYLSGIRVNDRSHLITCIPSGADLDVALRWFDHRDDPPEDGPPKRKIYFERRDRSYRYADSDTLVTERGDLYAAFEDTPLLSDALAWFSFQTEQKPGTTVPQSTSPDDRILSLLAEASVGGMALSELSTQLKIEPSKLIQILEDMAHRQKLGFYNKRWFLKQYSPAKDSA